MPVFFCVCRGGGIQQVSYFFFQCCHFVFGKRSSERIVAQLSLIRTKNARPRVYVLSPRNNPEMSKKILKLFSYSF